jgi:DNA-directed RNA polymerase II subunit RPB1
VNNELEMNIFLPQEIQSKTELELIANVKYQIVGSKDSNPIIGSKQDGILGSHLLTLDDVELNAEDGYFLLSNSEGLDLSKLDKKKTYTGKEIFSQIIPQGINSSKKKDGKFIFQVQNGELKIGSLNKGTVSAKKNSLVHYIWDKYSGDETRKFIDNTEKLAIHYLEHRGYTIGFQDCFLDMKVMEDIRNKIREKLLELNYEITEMENQSDMLSYETYESSIFGSLSAFGANTYKIAGDNLTKDNNFYLVTNGAQSKGNETNIGKMVACLSQSSIDGKRPRNKVNGRASVHFHYNDDTAIARGFISNNLLTGMTGHEYFFHSMGGREGQIDTAVKTAATGYIERKLIKTMEDLLITYDGTVRNSTGQIVQFLYSDNGIDQTVQADVKIPSLMMNNEKIKEFYLLTEKELKETKTSQKMNQEYYKLLTETRDKVRQCYMTASLDKVMRESFLLPVNMERLTQGVTDDSRKIVYDLTGDYILEKIQEILVDKHTDLIAKMNDKKLRQLQMENELLSKLQMKLALLDYLSPKKCVYQYKINKTIFDELIDEIKKSFLKAVVNPGEMVGIITAQSLGEPVTQMNMNSRHFAGVASKKKVTAGVPRIEELLSYSKNIKAPAMTLFLDKENRENEALAKTISSFLNHIKVGELINKAEIYYYQEDTKDELSQQINEDQVGNPFFFNNTKKVLSQFPWLIRLELDREKMLDLEVVMLDIKTKILGYYYNVTQNLKSLKKEEKEVWASINGGAILSNLDTSDTPTIHIRLGLNNVNFPILTNFLKVILEEVKLKGIDKIDNGFYSKELYTEFTDKGDAVQQKQYLITTDGININEVRKFKFLDQNKTFINDTETILRYYGIEAARNFLAIELFRTFETNAVSLNFNHLSVLADLITFTGEIVSIDRHGNNRLDLDPMARSTFERTMEHFINASIFNEKDKVRATSSKVMVGQVIPGGTGCFDLILDTDKLANSEYLDDEYQGRTTFEGLMSNPFMDDLLETDQVNVDFLTN